MPQPSFISFVIPAWNEETVLGATLEELEAVGLQPAAPSEVIVCEDSYTYGTAEIARWHGAQVVSVCHRQISATRNAGRWRPEAICSSSSTLTPSSHPRPSVRRWRQYVGETSG